MAALTMSIVVVAFEMQRELPRTLRSLAPDYQRGIDADDYEVVVVDNGSSPPLDLSLLSGFDGRVRTARVEPGLVSPARAANLGLAMADGAVIGLLIDGARLASPGLLAQARLATRVADRPVVATLGWHLGEVPHMQAGEVGYDQAAEDRLLGETDWEADGYRLFEISTFAGSSRRGFFGPLGESNGLFMPRAMWSELGRLDERFSSPGGGRVNHDLFCRACGLPGARLVVLLGEGTFHQLHGGIATSRAFAREEWEAEYESLRGRRFTPSNAEPIYFGAVHPAALPHLDASVRWARRAEQRGSVTPSASGSRPD